LGYIGESDLERELPKVYKFFQPEKPKPPVPKEDVQF